MSLFLPDPNHFLPLFITAHIPGFVEEHLLFIDHEIEAIAKARIAYERTIAIHNSFPYRLKV